MKKKSLMIAVILMFITLHGFSQQYSEDYLDSVIKSKVQPLVARSSRFNISGFTSLTASFNKDKNSFSDVVLSPILLWQPHQRILVEAELEMSLPGGETNIELGYADASFILNKYVTARAGKFIAPFGIFQDRLHPGWINKLPTFPVGIGEDDLGVGPTSEIGFNLLGGIPLGSAKMNYSVFFSNAAQLATDPSLPDKQGTLTYGNIDAPGKRLSVGGRLGFLPFANSSFELGFSYRNGRVANQDTLLNANSVMYALDLTYVEQLDFIKGTFDIKGQWNKVSIDNVPYIDPDDLSGTYTFNNSRSSEFLQAAYKPSMSQSKFLKKTELVFRYAGFNAPSGAKGLEDVNQYTYGIDYWFNWRTALKLAYQSQKDNNIFFIQTVVGF